MRKLRIALALALLGFLILSANSGAFLVVDDAQRANVIVVLAGETNRRPERGLELLSRGYAPKLLLDVPTGDVIYNQRLIDIAQLYIQQQPDKDAITICPIFGLSTKAEARDVSQCLSKFSAQRILIVTSDYHTRRARSIFAHELRGKGIFVTPAFDAKQFGTSWWRHRQWAKTTFDEWLKTAWWELIDRWRR